MNDAILGVARGWGVWTITRRYDGELPLESAYWTALYGELLMTGEELEDLSKRLEHLAFSIESTYCLWCWKWGPTICRACWERFIRGLRPPWQPDGVARRASEVKLSLGTAMSVVAELIAAYEVMRTVA